MPDNVNITVNETTENVVINPSISTDVIDVNISSTTESIGIAVTPELTTININSVTGGTSLVTTVNGQIGDVIIPTSDNNFTNALKTKLDGIQVGAEVNVNADWNATSGDSQILNKPTIPSISGLATTTYVDSQDALKVDKIAGKGLSTNDYTTAEQTKLAGIQPGAEVNVNADWNATSGDAQILNKPTIPSISGLATTSYVDSQDALKVDKVTGKSLILDTEITRLSTVTNFDNSGNITALAGKVDKVTGSRLITSAESTLLGNTSGVNTGDQDLSGLVPKTTTVNSKALSSNITLNTSDIADSTDKRYVTDANLTTIGNQSGTNTGDNAVNSLYSGLATSKQDTLTLTTTGTSGAATLIGATLNIPQYSGGGGGGTVTSVSALTLGTTGTDLSSSVANSTTTPVITLNVPTASASNRGALSSSDWNTFNAKQDALVSGTNIKTINGNSVLGSGDLVISGGSSPFTKIAIGTTGTIVTGTTTNTITQSILIPANTFTSNNGLDVIARFTKTGSVGGGNYRMYINTSNSITGATLIATFYQIAAGAVIQTHQNSRSFFYNGTNLSNNVGPTASNVTDMIQTTVAQTSVAYNSSVDYYLIFAIQLTNGADSSVMNGYRITQYA
jgi:hypothetical protein